MQTAPEPRYDLRWDDVRLFLTLCRSRTVATAANALGVDASTVSRRLATLEEELDASLFDRNREGITPTEAAENLMPVAEEIEQGMLRFANAAQGLEREVSGLVRLACAPDVAVVFVVPLLRQLYEKHPKLRIELEEGTAIADLTRREADIALRTARPTRGDLVFTRLLSVPWIAAASPAVAASLGKLRQWTDAPWVGWTERYPKAPPMEWLAKHAPDVDPVLRSDTFALQINAVVAGVGVLLMPARSAEHHGLVEVKVSSALKAAADDWPVTELYLVTHRALRDVPRIRAVWESLANASGSLEVRKR